MLKNISVSAKGFAAFGILALIAIGTSAIIHSRATTATTLVENNLTLVDLLSDTGELSDDVTAANLALKNFLLTGNRDFVTTYQDVSGKIDAQSARLEELYAAEAPGELKTLQNAKASLDTWRSSVVERQIQLMRDPMTVDLARAIELTGEGAKLLGAFNSDIGSVEAALQQRGKVASADQKSALHSVESISLLAAGLVALFAAGLGFLNFYLVSKPLSRLADVTSRLANGDLDVTLAKAGSDEIGQMTDALAVFREGLSRSRALEMQSSEQRRINEEARKVDMARVADELQETVGSIGEEIIAASRALNETARSLSEIASATTDRAMSVSSTAEETTANVQTVASASEELSASINEVSGAVRSSSEIANNAVKEVERSSEAIDALNTVVDRIGDVTTLINDIAAQTNLLALNATIEAARAGEAGRGFAIVAQEVKALAGQTAKATEEIDREIQAMKSAAMVSMEASRSASQLVAEMSERSSTIAAAAEQQNAATVEIARNVNEAATGTRDVAQSIISVSEDARRTGELSTNMQEAVEALFQRAALLGDTMTKALERIKAA
ncbi:Methyl-accepting chemotaxis protein 4 [Hartmannibacter diazotrophicus]|uniref:Methyl-accepting chemotaxis protein 4 n=1 Tax=Hartmannibacter diazotrophicus TaxID=1482074 RepID=A0A2C9DDL1_9HYPH|nr:methyl-accepting chemotaxis protein [Hartmannibacter diazotrophicus]SON57705.1 Methyl-accepting chemotaxis protein 4 [Hartmannibacter diazotrophicus]